MVHVHVCEELMRSDLKQDSPGGVSGCGCGSVEEGELCGTVAVEGGGQSQ